MKVKEVFCSLQGEGANAGRAAVFVRFAGCNLSCEWCDTDWSGGKEMSEEEVIAEVRRTGVKFVVLTGGEPSLQLTDGLVEGLHRVGCEVAVETNGTRALPAGVDWVTCSPKVGADVVLQRVDEVKVVYVGQDVERYREIEAEHYFLQPCERRVNGELVMNAAEVVEYCLKHPWWRLSVQLHKVLGIK